MVQIHPDTLHHPALNAMSSSLAFLDMGGAIIAVNSAWKQGEGGRERTLIGHAVGTNYLQICSSSDSTDAHIIAQGLRCVIAGQAHEYDRIYPCTTGHEERWFHLRATRIVSESSEPYVLLVHEDVTEHKRVEAALQQHVKFTRSLLESSPDCVEVISLHGDLLWMNEGGQRLMEIEDFRQFQGTNWVQFWPLEAQELAQQALEAGRRGESGRFQSYCPTVTGTLKLWDVLVTPLKDVQGRPMQLLCSSRDVTALRMAQDETLKKTQETSRILSSIQEAFFAVDDQWCFTYLNPQAEELLQTSAPDLLGQCLWEVYPEAADSLFSQQYHTARREQRRVEFEAYFAPLKIYFKVTAYPYGQGLAVLFQNINAAKAEERAQQDRNTILEMTVAGRPLPEVLEQVTLMVQRQFPDHLCAVFLSEQGHLSPYAAPGLSPELRQAIERLEVREGNGPCSAAALRSEMIVAEDTATHPSCVNIRDLLLLHHLRSCISLPISTVEQGTLGTVALYAGTPGPFPPQAVRELEKARHLAAVAVEHHRLTERLAHQTQHDPLTGLGNRRLFEEQLESLLKFSQAPEDVLALVFIDIDDFKSVNDHLGHHAGDQILGEVAERLRGAVRQENILARISGDEFTVILPHASEAVATLVAQRILSSLEAPFTVEEREVYVSASIGISLTLEGGRDAASLKRSADLAMYHAKSHKTGFTVFRSEMNRHADERFQLATHLRRALELNELELHYQPQVQLQDGAMIGVEALLRWHHPELGLVSPARFIPLAEETGLIVPIGAWALQQACEQGVTWQREGRPCVRIAVNVSALQFERADFVEMVATCLRITGFPAELLELELTERVVMRSVEDSVRRMHQLRDLGVSIAMDDFGTGYSSLSYLPRLPLNILKIDRSFVSGLDPSSANFPVVQAILSVAGSLHLKTIAEGIETQAERQVLLGLGCTLGQGYLFARPCPAHELFPT